VGAHRIHVKMRNPYKNVFGNVEELGVDGRIILSRDK
jgi:hypothetical protein